MNQWIQKIFYATGCAFELARGVIIFAVVLALVTVFIATVNVVNGASMEPNFHDKQYVIVDKLSYYFRTPHRGEAVIIKFPGDPDKVKYIKRVVGLPGETLKIEDDVVYINGKALKELYIPSEYLTEPNFEWKLGKNEYFLMGDNRQNSNDSRVFGPVEKRFIIGLAYMVIFPPKDVHVVPPQFYNISR